MSQHISVVYNKDHIQHYPLTYPSSVGLESYPEKAERVETIYKALHEQSFARFIPQEPFDISLLQKVHSVDYVSFLQSLEKKIHDKAYYYPTEVFHQSEKSHDNVLAELGRFSFDLSAPVDRHIFKQALVSAFCAYTAALQIKKDAKIAYSLSRPPGHHAMKQKMGGFCYINNAAVAAEYLSQFGKVAVLDVDYHHGNGTQDIFYERDDILTTSIHADPKTDYPYYWGFANEVGMGKGRGFNANYPLRPGATEHEYQSVLQEAVEKVKIFQPQYLVVPFGIDTYIKDSLGTFQLTTKYYATMAKTIKTINVPTVVIQEGGYYIEDLGKNVVSFLSGLISSRCNQNDT